MLSLKGNAMLLYLWHCFDKQGHDEYIRRELAEDECNLAFVCQLCVGAWRQLGDDGQGAITGWSLSRNSFGRYIDEDTVCESIDRIRLQPAFWKIDNVTLQATAAVYLIAEKGLPDVDDSTSPEISQEEVEMMLKNWRDEYLEG